MTRICYDSSLRFQKAARLTLEQANSIIEEYGKKGFRLTIRQLYYQFVARKLVPENTLQQYKRLVDIMSRGRLAGLVDWEAIVDITRYVRDSHFNEDRNYLPFLKGSAAAWTIDWWQGQKFRPLVLIEKDALVSTIDGICEEYQVPYMSCRGYTSQSQQWRLGNRLRRQKKAGLTPIVFHFGDRDPSGVDMTRDNESRLWMFGGHVELIRVALNQDQVDKYNPPANFTKPTDSRTTQYNKKFGTECWELDALDPEIISDLVKQSILSVLDQKTFDERKAENVVQTKEIVDLVDTLVWPPVPEPERDPYEWIDPWK